MPNKPLTERDIDTLGALRSASDNFIDVYNGTGTFRARGFVAPMDCGGFNGSHHSATLSKLVRHGLAERHKNGSKRVKGSCRYRINEDGRALLANLKQST